MNNTLTYTLITDGSSDSALRHIIGWLLDDLYPQLPHEGVFADFRNIKNPPPTGNVAARVRAAHAYYPCHILFYHRDAEQKSDNIIELRKTEILSTLNHTESIVCIVPIVMMEAWLLIDEAAIKKAAGNRNNKSNLNLPNLRNIENHPNPKTTLHELLKTASGLRGRNLKKFNADPAVHLVAEYISDFSPLRALKAFQVFEQDLRNAVAQFLKS
ncbi:MAG TPA: hypothetical protein PK239_16710 [Chitinophagales bacterium]|nr:hypothetical protein [Chitinophagales bacterium]